MSATATKEPKAAGKAADLVSLLGIDCVPLADLKGMGADDLAIAQAWAGGLIEFGHRAYCTTGPAGGKPGSELRIEDGWVWSGPKTKTHKGYKEIAAEVPPKTEKCKVYKAFPPPPDRPHDEPQLRPVEVPHEQAHNLIALHVRLTDKGLGGE